MIQSYNKNINRKIRVFISSTFSDMGQERDIIVNSVFPRLRKEFQAQMIDIMEVDLRWGIPEDITENNKILEICIGEVLHCFPFFIGMIGEQYGTLASKDAIEQLPPYYKRALGENIPEMVSITELEMRAGVLNRENKEFAAFYIRKQKENEGEDLRIKMLSQQIMNSCDCYLYKDVEEFEQEIFKKLKKYITKLIPEKIDFPYEDKDFFSHLKILKSNVTNYIPDNMFVTMIERQLETTRFVYVYGEKGTGKSALLSWILKCYGIERDKDVFFHFSAAGGESFQMNNFYYRFRLYLEDLFKISSIEKDDRIAVSDLLTNTREEKSFIICVDAIEQLDDVGAICKLKEFVEISPYVSVVCSGTENYSDLFGGQQIRINELSSDQIRLILKGTLQKYGKKLSAGMKMKIVNNENCKNPLFLKVLIAQLRVYGTFHTFESYFEQLMGIKTLDELFCVIIKRVKMYFIEYNLSSEKVNEVLALLVYSYQGISENEIQENVELLPVARSVLLSAIELFTIEDKGLIKFNHDVIIAMVKTILNETEVDYEKWVASTLIQYFEKKENDWRTYCEQTYQFCKLKDLENLYIKLSDKHCFCYLMNNEYSSLVGYLSFLNRKQQLLAEKLYQILNEEELIKASELFCKAGCNQAAIFLINSHIETVSKNKRIILLETLAKAQYHMMEEQFEAAIRTYLKLLKEYQEMYPDDEIGYVKRKYLLGCTYATAGNMKLANTIFEECANVMMSHQVLSASEIDALSAYSASCYAVGRAKEALSILEYVIKICLRNYGKISHEIARAYCYGWSTLYILGEKNRALDMSRKSYEVCKRLFFEHGPAYAWAAMNVGTAAFIEGNFSLAKEMYLKSIYENDSMLPEKERPHIYSLTTYSNLAMVYESLGQLEKAEEIISFTVKESLKKNGSIHINSANFLLVSAIIKRDIEELERAISIYKNQEEFTPDYYFAQICYCRILVNFLKNQEAEEYAKMSYKEYLQINRRTEIIDYLFLETIDKISGNLTEEEAEQLDDLYKFDDYRIYISHSNNSCIMKIIDL